MARHYHMPLFLLGGATADYLAAHPEYVRICCNGLSLAENLQLVQATTVATIAERVVTQIGLLHGAGGSSAAPALHRGSAEPLRRRHVTGWRASYSAFRYSSRSTFSAADSAPPYSCPALPLPGSDVSKTGKRGSSTNPTA